MAGLVLTVNAPGWAVAQEITVQIFNNANAPQSEVRTALREAGWMFRSAGIAIHWVECPPLDPRKGADQVCREAADPALFVLSINAEEPPERSDAALGFALVQGRSNHAAAVYPRIVAEMASDSTFGGRFVLGGVLAHELAHLMFRSTRHGEGVMQAKWSTRDYRAMAQRRLTFTEDQARTMRRRLAERKEGEGRTHAAADYSSGRPISQW
jgi:hypothetical protein